jgi:hypothetical protein
MAGSFRDPLSSYISSVLKMNGMCLILTSVNVLSPSMRNYSDDSDSSVGVCRTQYTVEYCLILDID